MTRCQSANSCFLLFLVSEKLYWKYSRNWMPESMKSLFYPEEHGVRRRPGGGPWAGPTIGWCGPPWPLRQVVWGPRGSTDIAPSPIYSHPRENPKYPSTIPRKVPTPPSSSTLVREGSEALPGTLPEREITPEAFFITMPASEVMREYFISGLRVHSSS